MLISFFWGIATHTYKTFPYSFLMTSAIGLVHTAYQTPWLTQWYYQRTTQTQALAKLNKTQIQAGLTKLVMVGENNSLLVKVIQADGTLVHQWLIDWFSLWPEPTHLQDVEIPKSRPGTHIHGAQILSNGDLVFNFEHLGLMRINACGEEVWKLPYRTHHSIFQDLDNTLWVSGQINYFKDHPKYKNMKGPYVVEPSLLQISEQGKILKEISVVDLLTDNNLSGLMSLSTIDNFDMNVSEDFLHLNDIEIFPSSIKGGVFNKGDILISLRNINTLLVFDQESLQVKYQLTGVFLRQHDPDFIDENRISIYDNNNNGAAQKGSSRILIADASSGQVEVVYEGSENQKFYSQIMGKHQWLENGNLLITESMAGRAFEINNNSEIIWDYFNIVKPGWIGIIEEAERLAPHFNQTLFENAKSKCSNKS
jgi:hypothetical protein